jgi:cell division protein FtsW (lipid II flippase)
MDDLVIRGVAGLIGIYLVLILLLFALCMVVRLMYTLLAAGDYGSVLCGVVAILVALSLYMAIGCWLRETEKI